MNGYLFSIEPEIYAKVRRQVEELGKLNSIRRSEMSEDESLKITEQEMELESKIESALLKSKAKREELSRLDKYSDEGMMLVNLTFIFVKDDAELRKMNGNPLSPEEAKQYWGRVKQHIDKGARKKAIEHAASEDGSDKKRLAKVFDKWVSVLRHAAENGNWYYMMAGGF